MRAATLFLILCVSGASGDAGDGCARCHEIAPTVAQWRQSSHRNVACQNCHGGSLQADNVRRVITHVRGKTPEHLTLDFQQVGVLVDRCRDCHGSEYASWNSGPHGTTIARIFTDEKHNHLREPMDDCLRCHGMFYRGGIRDLLTRTESGTYVLTRQADAGERVIPCIACHSMHVDGAPHVEKTAKTEKRRPSLAFWDRRSGEHIPVDQLPLPAMLEGDRIVRMSPDARQALCYQCHAPLATMQAGSGDDRTPLGVHEGLSCLACHAKHGQSASASCANCHPRLSNCGLDVEQMDTTFKDAKSRHNVHTVKCLDCHPKGVPKKTAHPAGRQGVTSSALR